MAAAAKSTAVLGGGIAGLSAAYYLAQSPKLATISLFEAARRTGGWIKTEQHASHGFRFEKGPRTIRPVGERGANTLRLIEQLGLSSSLVPVDKSHVAAQNRMIYVHNQLHLLPSSLGSLFRTLPPFSRPLIAAALTDLWTGRSPAALHDESIYDFAERRFGVEPAKYLVSSMICGICAGDAKQISVKFLMDEVFRKEQQYGGVLKGIVCGMFEKAKGAIDANAKPSALVERSRNENWSVFSFREGLEKLPQTLVERLAADGVAVELNTKCKRIHFTDDNRIELTLNDSGVQRLQTVERLVSSIPTNALAPLVEQQHPQLAAELAAIEYVDVALVNLQYDGDQHVKRPGFGFLVPPSENLPILGVIYDSCCFPADGKTVLTVMMGGAWFRERFGDAPSNKHLFDIAVQNVERILEIRQSPAVGRVHLLRGCIPQYVVGHRDRVQRIRQYIGERKLPLALCGAAYDGVGVNDVIFSARQAVEMLERC